MGRILKQQEGRPGWGAISCCYKPRRRGLLLQGLWCRVINFADAGFACVAEEFGMNVVALLLFGFFYFVRDAVSFSPGILANSGYLPRYLYVPLFCLDRELVVGNLGCNPGFCRTADGGQFIAEVAVQ